MSDHPKRVKSGGKERRLSMFEEESFSAILKERLKDVSNEVVHTDLVDLADEPEDFIPESSSLAWKTSVAKVKFANTYRMEPKKSFQSYVVKKKASQILEEKLEKIKYNADTCRQFTLSLAEEIIASIKECGFDRYKFIVKVFIVEKKSQGIKIVSRGLWDTSKDEWTAITFENPSLFATAVIFSVYFE
uniref:Tctex1 domain-containing protein 3 n=1 Tax=Latimeria chalumnae TaxID=7897 RepID=M3XID6_LATCH|nr:PREDICTED: tctex1 domain-containing protein 3 [Latimeria chalumnae]|eukprot:XP_014349476.1 PREDICTED: tctex1 domain-containing protein 3 [Latimeria chalumnae]